MANLGYGFLNPNDTIRIRAALARTDETSRPLDEVVAESCLTHSIEDPAVACQKQEIRAASFLHLIAE